MNSCFCRTDNVNICYVVQMKAYKRRLIPLFSRKCVGFLDKEVLITSWVEPQLFFSREKAEEHANKLSLQDFLHTRGGKARIRAEYNVCTVEYYPEEDSNKKSK